MQSLEEMESYLTQVKKENQELKETKKNLEADVKKLSQSTGVDQGDIDNLVQENYCLNNQNTRLIMILEDVTQKVTQLNTTSNELEKDLILRKEEKISIDEKLSKAMSEIKSLQNTIQLQKADHKTELESLSGKNINSKDVELLKEIEALNSELPRYRELDVEKTSMLKNFEEKIKNLLEEHDSLNQRTQKENEMATEKLRHDFEDISEKNINTINDLSTKIHELEEQNKVLKESSTGENEAIKIYLEEKETLLKESDEKRQHILSEYESLKQISIAEREHTHQWMKSFNESYTMKVKSINMLLTS
jgi:DNA repair exonuclease SbcCD ATPase subunit